MDATIIEHISGFFRLNAEPFAATCHTYCVWWRRRKHRILAEYVRNFIEYAESVPESPLGDHFLWLYDLEDEFLD